MKKVLFIIVVSLVSISLSFIIQVFFTIEINCCGNVYPHSEIVYILNYATALSVFIPPILLIISSISKKNKKLSKIAYFFYLLPIILFIINVNVRNYIVDHYEPQELWRTQWSDVSSNSRISKSQ